MYFGALIVLKFERWMRLSSMHKRQHGDFSAIMPDFLNLSQVGRVLRTFIGFGVVFGKWYAMRILSWLLGSCDYQPLRA